MNKLISETYRHFEQTQRGSEMITILKSDAPQDLRDSVRSAHGERLPDDWIYCIYASILETLEGYTIKNADGLEDNRSEIVDGLVDVYTSDLTNWLSSNSNNVNYITEAQEEYGTQTDGFKILQMAQYKAIDEIYGHVSSYLEATI